MNTHTSHIVRLGALGAAALALAACGSDSDSGAVSVEDFCAEVTALEEANAGSEDEMLTEADIDQMRDLASRAPAEIRDDIETIADAMAESLDIEEEDFEAFFEVFLAPDVIAAGEALDEFSVNECGLEPSDGGDDALEVTELDGEVDTAQGSDGEAFLPDVSGVDDPLYNDFFGDEELVDPNVASIDGLQVYLDLNHTDAAWRTAWATSGASWGTSAGEWDISAGDLGDEDPVVVCEAIMDYLRPLEPTATLLLSLDDFSGDGAILVARADEGGACVAV